MNSNPVLLGVALVTAILLSVLPQPDAVKSLPVVLPVNRYEVAAKKTVLVWVGDGYGSGVAIRRTDSTGKLRWFVWTAAHVAKKDALEIRTKSSSFKAHVIARNEELDVALVDVNESLTCQPAEFNFVTPSLGQEIFVIGSPYGPSYFNHISFGRVSGLDEKLALDYWPWGRLDEFSGAVFPGNSGGPVFDGDGKVLGLVLARSPVVSLYLPVRYISVWAESAGLRWALLGESCPSFGEYDVPGVDLK